MVQIDEHRSVGNFRTFLQEELVVRCKKNPSFSLRAFALYLGVEPSFLSKILRGQRAVSKTNIEKFGARLGLQSSQIEDFKKQYEEAKKNVVTDLDFRLLSEDQFKMISDSYHFTILELAEVSDRANDVSWVAETLDITENEASQAIERLTRLGFMKNIDGLPVKVNKASHSTGNKVSKKPYRDHQTQLLNQAINAISDVPIEQRDQTSMTMAIDSSRMEEAKVMVKKFRRRMMRFFQSGKKPDDVYHLVISLFPATNFYKRREKWNSKQDLDS